MDVNHNNPLSYQQTTNNKMVIFVFHLELSKNPKALVQANELLERASTLMVTRPTSPCAEEESDSDSGL